MHRFSRNLLAIFTLILGLTFAATAQTAGEAEKGDQGTKVTRVGVLMPKVNLVEAKGDMEAGAALRNTYAVLLNSETIQVVALDSRLASLALEEAKTKNIDYILNLSLVQEQKKKRGGGLFGRIARDTGRRATWETANKVPYGGSTGGRIARTTARSAIINTGYTLSRMKIKIKKSDKFILDYAMTDAKGESLLAKTIEAKAKKKNDDQVLIKMFEESGEEIVKTLRASLAQ